MRTSVLLGFATILACAPAAPKAGYQDPCAKNSDCAEPFCCKDGKCTLDVPCACLPGNKRCNGNEQRSVHHLRRRG